MYLLYTPIQQKKESILASTPYRSIFLSNDDISHLNSERTAKRNRENLVLSMKMMEIVKKWEYEKKKKTSWVHIKEKCVKNTLLLKINIFVIRQQTKKHALKQFV